MITEISKETMEIFTQKYRDAWLCNNVILLLET